MVSRKVIHLFICPSTHTSIHQFIHLNPNPNSIPKQSYLYNQVIFIMIPRRGRKVVGRQMDRVKALKKAGMQARAVFR